MLPSCCGRSSCRGRRSSRPPWHRARRGQPYGHRLRRPPHAIAGGRRREPNLQKLQRTSTKPSSHQLARLHLLAATAGQTERNLLRASRRAEAALEKGVAGATPPQPLQPHAATAGRKEISRGSQRNTALLDAAHTRRSRQTPAAPKSTPPSPIQSISIPSPPRPARGRQSRARTVRRKKRQTTTTLFEGVVATGAADSFHRRSLDALSTNPRNWIWPPRFRAPLPGKKPKLHLRDPIYSDTFPCPSPTG
jgi:hypothetical protein